MKKTVLAAALAALFATSAQATTYHLTTAGTGVTLVDGWAVGVPVSLVPPAPVSFAWAGTIDLSTAASTDGTYTGASLTSFDAQAAISGPRPAYAIFGFHLNPYGGGDRVNFEAAPIVTIAGGLVTSIVASARYLPGPVVSFDGASLIYEGTSFHAGTTHSSGIATNYVPIPPVPEPETWALMLAGFGVVASLHRRRRGAQ